MIQLNEVPRQILAGGISAAGFLVLFFGANLIWWIALLLALAVYLSVLLIVRHNSSSEHIILASTVTQADIRAASASMTSASKRLGAVLDKVPQGDQTMIKEIQQHVESIRDHILADPEDYRRARRFISSYLGKMVESVEHYADLARRTKGRHQDRLDPLAARIRGYLPALEKIDTACLENDFVALESQMKALAIQMDRG